MHGPSRRWNAGDWLLLLAILTFLASGILATKYFPPSLGVGGKMNIPWKHPR